jgi:hypothetical protein
LRTTLVNIFKSEYGHDLLEKSEQQSSRPIVELFSTEVKEFSKYKMAKAYIRWTRNHTYEDLNTNEISQWEKLFESINKSLK